MIDFKKRYRTRDGRRVFGLHECSGAIPRWPIVGVITGNAHEEGTYPQKGDWTYNGRFIDDVTENHLDLIEIEEPK